MADFHGDKNPPSAPSVYSSISDLSAQYSDTLCYRCSSEFDRQRDAIWHCVDCMESFCKKCLQEHFRKDRTFRTHTIKDMAGMCVFKHKALPKQAPVEYLDTSCTHCARDNKAVRAIRYCKDCEENLCVTCLKWHNDNERYIGHAMKRVWEEKKERHEKCKSHPAEVISRYCKDHDVVCCIKCIHLDHRNCKFTEEIKKIEEDIERHQTYFSIKEKINKSKMNTLKLIKARKDDIKRIEDESHNILVEIETNRDRINEHLDRLEKKCKQELKVRYEKFIDQINQDLTQLDALLSKLDDEADKLQTFEEDNESQQFISIKQAEEMAKESNTLEKKVDTAAGSEYLNFNLNINIIDTICAMNCLGDFSILKLSLSDKFDVKTKRDKNSCYVVNSCLMCDGSVIVVDYNNSNIKKLNPSYKVTAECKLIHAPTAICRTNTTEVAISTVHGTIQFASVTNRISLTRSFQVGSYCYSIAYNDGELFVVCCSAADSLSNDKVVVYDTSGQLLRSLISNIKGIYHYPFNTHLAISSVGKRIHIAHNSLGLVTMDKTGKKLWEHTEQKEIYGIITTENDSLIVCHVRNGENIFLMIDRDGKKKIELFKEKIQKRHHWPASIMYDASNSKLIVSSRHSDTIYMYNFTSA